MQRPTDIPGAPYPITPLIVSFSPAPQTPDQMSHVLSTYVRNNRYAWLNIIRSV